MSETHTRIAALAKDRIALDLRTEDVCFLAALQLHSDASGEPVFSDDRLVATFAQVCELVDPGADNVRSRATHAIQRMVDQRMLARIDGAGLVRSGDYALSPMAVAIVKNLLDDEALTRESLTLLTTALRAQLGEVKQRAHQADSEDEWRQGVIEPLRVTVRDLLAGIDRRARGLDEQHIELQRRIADLLDADWFSSIDRCESLLGRTTETLAELKDVLLRDAADLHTQLQDIGHAAEMRDAHDALAAVQQVSENVDRLTAWGQARQRSWSEYHRYVHGFLRDVVRLDPERALSQRLRDQIAGWSQRPFRLVLSDAEPMRILRPIEPHGERERVTRAHRRRTTELAEVQPDARPAALESAVETALASRPAWLSEVLTSVLPEIPAQQHYVVIGRIAELVATRVYLHRARRRAWVKVAGPLEVQDWQLGRQRKGLK